MSKPLSMRNIFDQYSQPENRVTHALMTALNEDRRLLGAFLADITRQAPGKKDGPLQITEQSYPGATAEELDEGEMERRGIPDAWITAGSAWCLIIENKVLGTPSVDQLRRHLATARRLGFDTPKALLISARPPGGELPDGVSAATWNSIYVWLQGQAARSQWAHRVAAYLEVMEARLTDSGQMDSGTLTAFNGFRFGDGNAFSYLEGKRVLHLAINELRGRPDLDAIGVDRERPGRKAIRGQAQVWDYLAFAASDEKKGFTANPHLSLVVDGAGVRAMVTLPDQARVSRRRLTGLAANDFRGLIDQVADNMRPVLASCPGMEPRLRAVQRHWINQARPPFVDAEVDVDLRTRRRVSEAVKAQPEWIDSVFEVLCNKNSNVEVQVGARFPYGTCEAIRLPEAVDHVAAAWIACKPYLSTLGVL